MELSTLILVLFVLSHLAPWSTSRMCGTKKLELNKCGITAAECRKLSCTFEERSWLKANCIGCKKSRIGTKIVWTFRNSKLPPNICVSTDDNLFPNASILKLPRCFIDKELNEGNYTCKEIDIVTNSTINTKSFHKSVDDDTIQTFDQLCPNFPQSLRCGYSFCANKFIWKFSKTLNGTYGPLPKYLNGNSLKSKDGILDIFSMIGRFVGYYKCEVESRNFSAKTSAEIFYLEFKPSCNKSYIPHFTSCHQRQTMCASLGKYYRHSCRGVIPKVDKENDFLLGVSCESWNKSKESVFGNMRNNRWFNRTLQLNNGKLWKGFQFWANASNHTFEVNIKVPSLDSPGSISCNFTVQPDVRYYEDVQSFEVCFKDLTQNLASLLFHIFIPIIIVICLLFLALTYEKFKYEIRLFMYQNCGKSSSRADAYNSQKLMIVYAEGREEFAQHLEGFIQAELPDLTIWKVLDGFPGEEMGHQLRREIKNTAVVIFILEKAAFSNQPSIFENALRMSFDSRFIQRMYIMLNKDFKPPPSFNGVDYLEVDLARYSGRDRKVVWSEPLNDNKSCQIKLMKRLRLRLTIHSRRYEEEEEIHMEEVPWN